MEHDTLRRQPQRRAWVAGAGAVLESALGCAHAPQDCRFAARVSVRQMRPRAVASRYSTRYSWYVIVLLSAVNLFNGMDRTILSVLLPQIKADLVLSDTQLGLLTGLAFSLFYASCG